MSEKLYVMKTESGRYVRRTESCKYVYSDTPVPTAINEEFAEMWATSDLGEQCELEEVKLISVEKIKTVGALTAIAESVLAFHEREILARNLMAGIGISLGDPVIITRQSWAKAAPDGNMSGAEWLKFIEGFYCAIAFVGIKVQEDSK